MFAINTFICLQSILSYVSLSNYHIKIYWSSSGTSVSPGEAIDAIKMTDRWYLWSQKISFHLFKFWNSCASKRKHAGQPWDGPMTRLPFTPSSALMRVNPMKPDDNDYIWLWRSEEEKATKVQFLHLDHDQCQGGNICDLTGIPALQPPNLQFIHWMVSNVPGDRVCTFRESHVFIFFQVVSTEMVSRFMLETRTMSTSLLSASNLTPTTSL